MSDRRASWSRREFVGGLTLAGTAGLVGVHPEPVAAEPPPETTRLRLVRTRALCFAPLHLAEELLQGEGFAEVRQVAAEGRTADALASDRADLSMDFIGPLAIRVDAGDPILILAGGHVGCHEVFGTDRIRSLSDLRGRSIAVPSLGSGQHVFLASMLTYVGLDPRRDVTWVSQPASAARHLLAEGTIDAVPAFPPDAHEFRARRIGRVVVNTATDPPWSGYFCCMLAGNREFIRQHPVATKRALRAILKSADLCALESDRVTRLMVDRGYAQNYDDTLQTVRELGYRKWRELDPEDTIRFYALRLHEAGMIQSSPQKIIAQGTDWRFLNELKKELKG
jgi:NitT/TauT family transport system substrate-binding protein